MKKQLIVKSALIVASLPLLAGCVERQVVYRDRPVYVQQPPPGPPGPPPVVDTAPPPPPVVVDTAPPPPPPPPVEVLAVRPGPPDVYYWVPGAYDWRGRWVWVGGRWGVRPHPGAIWIGGGWGYRGGHRYWASGHWR